MRTFKIISTLPPPSGIDEVVIATVEADFFEVTSGFYRFWMNDQAMSAGHSVAAFPVTGLGVIDVARPTEVPDALNLP